MAPALRPRLFLSGLVALTASLLATGCGEGNDAPVVVSVIGSDREASAPLAYAHSRAGQVMLAATARGLVRLDATGTVIPALAQRWIVIDDGKSYIFRLRRARWADGAKVDAREVKRLLQVRLRARARLDPYGPLSSVDQILAMTDDVLELTAESARVPNFLVALAEPDMAIARSSGGSGPYRKRLDQARRVAAPCRSMLLGKVDEEALPAGDPAVARGKGCAGYRALGPNARAISFLAAPMAELPYVSAWAGSTTTPCGSTRCRGCSAWLLRPAIRRWTTCRCVERSP
jgi:oligopeptide transport system substrate-binding protein